MANFGEVSACEKGRDCDAGDCLDLPVQLSEIGFDHFVAAGGVQFNEFRVSVGKTNLNVYVNTPCEV